jgi:hypothetical protein
MNELPSASMGTNLLETSLSIVSGVAVLTWLGLAAAQTHSTESRCISRTN